MAAGITFTEKARKSLSVKKITAAWTSAHSGAISDTTTNAYDGQLLAMQALPGVGAASGGKPTDDYDVTITDANGHDVALSAGADLNSSGNVHKDEQYLGAVSDSKLTFNITNAGSFRTGTLVVWIR